MARLRLTAPRIWRLAAKAARVAAGRGRQSRTKARRSSRRPCWKTAWISLGCRRRASRESRCAPTAAFTPARLDAEPLASFRAPPLEDLAPALGLHAGTEAVCFLPPPLVRLKCPLHGETPSLRSTNLRSVLTAFKQVKMRDPLAGAFHGVLTCRTSRVSQRFSELAAECKGAARTRRSCRWSFIEPDDTSAAGSAGSSCSTPKSRSCS